MQEYNYRGADAQDAPPRIAVQTSDTLAKGAIIADLFVTVIVIAGMAYDRHSVTVAVLSGVTFFLVFGALVILTLSGALPAMVINGQNQRTIRHRDAMQYQLWLEQATPPQVTAVDPPQLPYTEPAEAMQLPPVTSSFVAPYAEPDNSVRREVLTWLMQLYKEDGEPDPKKVLMKSGKERPGRIRVAAPSRPAKQWLVEHRVLQDLGGTGFRLNLAKCPTLAIAQTVLNLPNVVGGSPTPYHPPQIGERSAA